MDGNQPTYHDLLEEWDGINKRISENKEQMKGAIAREQELRVLLFSGTFAAPTEGKNSFAVATRDGSAKLGTVIGEFKQTYTIDEAAIGAVLEQMKTDNVPNWDKLVRWKPELEKKVWKGLTEAEKLKFAPALTIKPAMCGLTYVPEGEANDPQ